MMNAWESWGAQPLKPRGGVRSGVFATLLAAVAVCSAVPAWSATPVPLFHSHNDYQNRSPLLDALETRMDSVEADIWLVDGEILVSHLGFKFAGSLEELYLSRLEWLIEREGSVYGDGRPFYLWLDIKEGSQELRNELRRLFGRYNWIFHQRLPGTNLPAVSVVLTGHDRAKRDFLKEVTWARTERDSNYYRPEDPPSDGNWTWYALNWRNFFGYDGKGPISPHEQARLAALVGQIHGKGRRIRFWNTPDSPIVWDLLYKHGVDMIGADNIQRLRKFHQDLLDLLPMPNLIGARPIELPFTPVD